MTEGGGTGGALGEAVRDALRSVFDPCSLAMGAPISIVDMGLVTAVAADEAGRVRIDVRTTTAMCTLAGSIAQGAEATALAVPGVTGATVQVLPMAGWTEEQMSREGRQMLETRRRRARGEVRPREWELRRPSAGEE
ncbi:metal-sulfur cluster assembly factor [Actinomadura fibrosa]|uniref:Metal-sulfur cluster assembly factor n=1 Tax=Actinomadura fibrosa TaxID=111802 RepID=A0ABW2XMZ8_9ACTN|nr:iron-sulfur cluster assembly protein [Actinomadura fibrosa]